MTSSTLPPGTKRRLYRIKEGQWFAGVCTGLAAYADFGVDWTRTLFALLAVITGGLFLVVYVVLIFVLPVVATRQEWLDLMTAPGATESGG